MINFGETYNWTLDELSFNELLIFIRPYLECELFLDNFRITYWDDGFKTELGLLTVTWNRIFDELGIGNILIKDAETDLAFKSVLVSCPNDSYKYLRFEPI